ncbi:hypothetical protein IU483_20815 [Streptomyces gardneri]|nr:hypothetical protein [Streptomyces gardneri]
MTNYFTHDKHGNYTKSESRPESGYYYAQEKPGGEVTLYEANPGGDPKKLDSWPYNRLDYLVTTDGQAYKKRVVDNVTRVDPDKRLPEHDRKAPPPPSPTESEQKKKYMEGLDKDPKEGDSVDDFPLKIKLPPGTPSEDLTTYVSLANHQLKYLKKQMGDKKKPIALASPEKGDDTVIWDNNLSKSFTDAMGNGAEAQAGGKGESIEAYNSTSKLLDELDAQWAARDDQFKTENLKLTADNDRTYRKMWDKVQSAHEDIWATLMKPHAGYFGGSTFSKDNFTAPGIQNVVEEEPIYGIIRDTVQFCVEEVTAYANRAESAGKKFGEFPGFPTKEQPGKDPNEKPATQHTPTGTTKTPTNTGTPPPVYTGTPPMPTQDASTLPSGTTANDNWGSTFDDLLGGPTDTDGSLTDPTTGTQPISATGTGDTSSDTDPLAAIRSALQGGTGSATGTGPGANTGTNAGNVPSAANSGDNGMANAMQQMAMMSAMSGMMNQGRQPEDERLERAYAEREREQEREKREERERNRNAQTTTAQQAVQQTGPAGVTPPTYAGTPPPITAPGTTPAVQIGDTTVNASPPVAEALQKQTQNVALDAVSAYKGTAGEITAEHPPAVVNGPGELKTGDILQWEKHSALVVKNENGLFVLDNGQLVPLDPNNPPLKEKYGNFAGFIHPTGLDTAAGSAPGIAAPPPPAVAAAPQPAAPPPVSPPPQGV